MNSSTSRLSLPADPAYIVVAKRAAAGFAALAGFDIEAANDLVIAVAHACENAILCTADSGAGGGCGGLKLTFSLEAKRLEVAVHSSCARSKFATSKRRRPKPIPPACKNAVHRHWPVSKRKTSWLCV